MIVWGYQKKPDYKEVKEKETKLEEQTMCLLLFFSNESLVVMLASNRKSIAMTAKKPLLKFRNVLFFKEEIFKCS